MKTRLLAAALIALAGPAFGQGQSPADHQHQGGQTQAAPSRPVPPQAQAPMGQMPMRQMMQGLPEQRRAMMQTMPEVCRGMIQPMMQGGTMRGAAPVAAAPAAASEATKAYLEAMERMHGPMSEGAKAADPDLGFVRAMIPHHEGAIDMAKIVLRYGKDEQVRKWANDVIREQQREIAEMQEWLKKSER